MDPTQTAIRQDLLNYIKGMEKKSQDCVEDLEKFENAQEESRNSARQIELDISWKCSGNENDRAICEDLASTQKPSLKPIYEQMNQQVSLLPRHIVSIKGTVSTAVRINTPSLAHDKKQGAQVAVQNINKTIETIIQKGSLIIQTHGCSAVPQDFLTVYTRMRQEFKSITRKAEDLENLWDKKVDDYWLSSLVTAIEVIESHMSAVTDAWKDVKIPEV